MCTRARPVRRFLAPEGTTFRWVQGTTPPRVAILPAAGDRKAVSEVFVPDEADPDRRPVPALLIPAADLAAFVRVLESESEPAGSRGEGP